jgi:integrase
MAAVPAHMRPAFGLLMYSGLGPKDALTLPKDCVRAGEISTRRSKTDQPVFLPMAEPLTEIMTVAPAHSAATVRANSNGESWTLSGFRASWRPIRKQLEAAGAIQPGLTLYGLRHTVAVMLRQAGFDERTIADYLGQRTIEMARHYAQGADLEPKMRGVVKELNRALNKTRLRVVKPAEKSVKLARRAEISRQKTQQNQ